MTSKTITCQLSYTVKSETNLFFFCSFSWRFCVQMFLFVFFDVIFQKPFCFAKKSSIVFHCNKLYFLFKFVFKSMEMVWPILNSFWSSFWWKSGTSNWYFSSAWSFFIFYLDFRAFFSVDLLWKDFDLIFNFSDASQSQKLFLSLLFRQ